MAKVEIIPRMFRRRLEPVATADPHYAAMIQIQGVLSPMTEEEQTFVLETVCRNLDINRRHLKAYEFEE